MTAPILFTLCCLIWGSTWLVIKIGLVGVPPFLGAGLRFLLASAVLFALVFARKARIALTKDDRAAVLSCGLFSFTLSYACVYWAEQYITSSLTAILFCTMPLIVALLSRFWTRSETLSARKIGGIAFGMVGTVILFKPDAGTSMGELWGMGAALLSAVAAGVNLVLVKRYGRHTDVCVMNALGMAFGAVCLLALSLATESYGQLHWTRANVSAIVYLALFGSVVAFLAYYHLAKFMDATAVSLITLVIPIVAVILGAAFMNEPVTARTWVGMTLILGGVGGALYKRPASATSLSASAASAGSK